MSSIDFNFVDTGAPLMEVCQAQQNFVNRFAASIAADNDAVTDAEYMGTDKPPLQSTQPQNKPDDVGK